MNLRGKKSVKENNVLLTRKGVVMIVSGIATVTAAIIGLHNVEPIIDPWMPATRGYVSETITGFKSLIASEQTTTNSILRDIQVEQAEGKLDATRDAIAKAQIEKAKTSDAGTLSILDQHLKNLIATQARLEEQLRSLKKARSELR